MKCKLIFAVFIMFATTGYISALISTEGHSTLPPHRTTAGWPVYESLDICMPSMWGRRVNIMDSGLPDNVLNARIVGSTSYGEPRLADSTWYSELRIASSISHGEPKRGRTSLSLSFDLISDNGIQSNDSSYKNSDIEYYLSASKDSMIEMVSLMDGWSCLAPSSIAQIQGRYVDMMDKYVNSDRFLLIWEKVADRFVSCRDGYTSVYFPWVIYLWNPKYLPDSVPVVNCDPLSLAGHEKCSSIEGMLDYNDHEFFIENKNLQPGDTLFVSVSLFDDSFRYLGAKIKFFDMSNLRSSKRTSVMISDSLEIESWELEGNKRLSEIVKHYADTFSLMIPSVSKRKYSKHPRGKCHQDWYGVFIVPVRDNSQRSEP